MMRLLKTTDGRLVREVVREFRNNETLFGLDGHFVFDVDGCTSGYIGNDGKTVKVDMSMVYVVLSCGENEMRLPNFGGVEALIINIEKGIDIMFWMDLVES